MPDRPALLLALAAAAVAGAAVAGLGLDEADGAAGPDGVTTTAGDGSRNGHDHGDHHDHGDLPADPDHPYANRHLLRDWPPPEGEIPTRREAETDFRRVDRVEIRSDADFNPANGVVAGNGTPSNPWVIEGLHVEEDLYVADTTDPLVIRESYVDGQLTLNWVGDRVHVHHNHVDDLRVNENVPRTGEATAGRIEANRIEHVGQIRHYDGVFRDNVVGPDRGNLTTDPAATLGARVQAMQLDGMHGGDFHDNAFTGWVEIKLHGHHHASCWTCLRHHHANATEAAPWDHTVRYHRMSFHDNEIRVPDGPALRYTDAGHDGDDGSAASEDVDELDLPHRHHTRVYFWNNTLRGGGLDVHVFNAESQDHPEPNPGRLVVRGNEIAPEADRDEPDPGLDDPDPGIRVHAARWVNLTVADNVVRYPEAADGGLARDEGPRGVVLDGFEASDVTVSGNRIQGAWHGVEARHLPEDVRWTVAGNDFQDVEVDVWWDSTVANPPERG